MENTQPQLDLFTPEQRLNEQHAYTRRDAAVTSLAAARTAKVLGSDKRKAVYDFIVSRGTKGATDEEIENATGLGGNTVRPRRLELKEAGLIRPGTEQRKTKTNHLAFTWVAV